jgi:FKBP-type peptidyl-prolyl cis-trans isomerase
MPSSKEARARQNRQKERVAAALAERRRAQHRRRRGGAVAGVILLVIVVAIGLAVGGSNNGTKVAVSPTSSSPATTAASPTTVALASAKGKPCVGLKDPLPKGAPALLLTPGPAPTKLSTQDLKVGSGAVVPKNAKVTVNYVGVACSTGKIFDSSYSRNQTFDADLASGVIHGWSQGIPGMKIGGVRLLTIPSNLAYGAVGAAPSIAPDESLYFLVAAVKLG